MMEERASISTLVFIHEAAGWPSSPTTLACIVAINASFTDGIRAGQICSLLSSRWTVVRQVLIGINYRLPCFSIY